MRWEWDWLWDHLDDLWALTMTHIYVSLLPIVLGLLIALPLGVLCARYRPLYPPVLSTVNALYALPAIALFAILRDATGFSPWTLIIPLTVYTLSILVPNVVDGLRSVPDATRQAAVAMGYSPLRRLIGIELPIAVPVVMAGLRVATVSSISLASVGTLFGLRQLGEFFTRGAQLGIGSPIVGAIVVIVVLALIADLVLVAAQRWLTPWARARTAVRA